MKVLLVDGYNLLHRSRFGFAKGEYNIVFNFLRGFRSLTDKIAPDRVVFVLEGYPKFRYGLYPEYKANRKTTDPKKQAELADFRRQKDICIELLKRLPIKIIRHPNYEGDDVIGSLIKERYSNDECVVATGDTDFIQLLNSHSNVKIYNPIKKTYFNTPDYDYVLWKSMVGDTSDNIKGIPRVGPKTATKVCMMSEGDRSAWLDERPERRSTLERNTHLIRFASVPMDELENVSPVVDYDYIREKFAEMQFQSMLTDKSWKTFVETFEHLGV
jgi:DNA polymerase-1